MLLENAERQICRMAAVSFAHRGSTDDPQRLVTSVNTYESLAELRSGDVTFLVQGENIKAHAAILCARSEVFEKQLTAGLRESTSKERSEKGAAPQGRRASVESTDVDSTWLCKKSRMYVYIYIEYM